jgi:hypothetical protein
MYNNNIPSKNELPSTAKLIKSTMVAMVLAAVILVTAVLPAEYGVDPTGVGNMLGLTHMGEIKVSLAQEAATEVAAGNTVKKETEKVSEPTVPMTAVTEKVEPRKAIMSDSITVSLKPNQGREVKVAMAKGSKVSYKWVASNGRANFDVHGDSAKLNINYFNYSKGSLESDSGVLEAEFDGKHGWFWRNRTGETMTITLEVEGEFTEMTQEV